MAQKGAVGRGRRWNKEEFVQEALALPGRRERVD